LLQATKAMLILQACCHHSPELPASAHAPARLQEFTLPPPHHLQLHVQDQINSSLL